MPDDTSALYPLKFKPIYKEKVWGGRRLTRLDRNLPGLSTTPIGESWEIADLGFTSPSGGGGGAERSVVAEGPLQGMTLHDTINQFGPTLMGRLAPDASGNFPLLVKYLDAAENLSVQVHPSPEYAMAHPDSHLKSEAWYIVDAEPNAVIYKGIHEGVTIDNLRSAIANEDVEAVESLLIKVPVKAGDCHYLPSGTCHALGAGVLVAEVQTPSDTTFRLFDWGRRGRTLHVAEALECVVLGPPPVETYERRSHIAGMFTTVSRLVECEHFRIEKIRMSEGYQQEIPYDQPTVWMVLEGGGTITPAKQADPVSFARGQTLLLPANLKDAQVALEHDTVWLEATFPQAMPEQIA